MRIVGLPVSLWEQDNLRRIGDACGGFLVVDSQTEKLEDLQWVRILVKLNGEKPPNVVEVWAKDVCYEITLWWEIKPALRMARERKSENKVVLEGEVGGEAIARVVEHVRGKDGDPSLEDLLQTDDGTRGQSSGSGQAVDPSLGSELVGPHNSIGPSSLWDSGPSEASGPYSLTAFPRKFGPPYFGLPPVKDYGRALDKLGGPGLGGRGPASSLNVGEAQLGVACPFNWSGPSNLGGPDQSMSSLWVFDGLWRPSAKEQSLEENLKTDCALMEEASRYGNATNFFGTLVCVSPSPPSFFGRTPSGEYYDRSGAVLDAS